MSFYSERIFCPNCPPVFNKRGDRTGEDVELLEQNYSGCSIDIVQCWKCKTLFSVSYKVDKIEEWKSV